MPTEARIHRLMRAISTAGPRLMVALAMRCFDVTGTLCVLISYGHSRNAGSVIREYLIE